MTIHAVWKNGHVVLDEAVDWQEGCQLEVSPVSVNTDDDDLDANDPEAIAHWIAEFSAIPSIEMTAEEEAEWRAAKEAQRAFELSTFNERADRIQQALP